MGGGEGGGQGGGEGGPAVEGQWWGGARGGQANFCSFASPPPVVRSTERLYRQLYL